MQLNDFPIWAESDRQKLIDAIYRRYWFSEIGSETPALFVYRLNARLWEIMPRYIQLYQSTILEFDALTTEKISDTLDGIRQNSTSANSSGNSQNVGSDTPNGLLDSVNPFANTYASQAAYNKSSGESTGEGEENYSSTHTITGYHSSPFEQIQKYRDSIIDIIAMIVEDLSNLFMGVW